MGWVLPPGWLGGSGNHFGQGGCPTYAVPIRGSDAICVEALGPPLAVLLLTGLLDLGPVAFHRDRTHVVCLLAGEDDPRDLHLFNCVSLTRDLLTGWPHTATWHPRAKNSACYALAREGAQLGTVRLEVGEFCFRRTH